jgi:hypothetical protein
MVSFVPETAGALIEQEIRKHVTNRRELRTATMVGGRRSRQVRWRAVAERLKWHQFLWGTDCSGSRVLRRVPANRYAGEPLDRIFRTQSSTMCCRADFYVDQGICDTDHPAVGAGVRE